MLYKSTFTFLALDSNAPSTRCPVVVEGRVRWGHWLVHCFEFPSVLWRCWLDDVWDVQPIKLKSLPLIPKSSLPEWVKEETEGTIELVMVFVVCLDDKLCREWTRVSSVLWCWWRWTGDKKGARPIKKLLLKSVGCVVLPTRFQVNWWIYVFYVCLHYY